MIICNDNNLDDIKLLQSKIIYFLHLNIYLNHKMNEIFKQQVWEITKLVPKGRVTSYGAIAKAVGFPNHSRHVGKAMGGCPKDVPAHRVISSSGTLSVPEFQERLENEGIEVENFRIKNFKKLFWNPLEEL